MFKSGNSDVQASARLHMSTRTFLTGLWGESDGVLECWQYFHCSGKANLCPGVIMILGHNLQVKYTKSFSASLLPAPRTRSPESSPLPSWRQLGAFTWRVRRCHNSDLSSRCFFLGDTGNHGPGNTWRYGAKQYHMGHQNLLTNSNKHRSACISSAQLHNRLMATVLTFFIISHFCFAADVGRFSRCLSICACI